MYPLLSKLLCKLGLRHPYDDIPLGAFVEEAWVEQCGVRHKPICSGIWLGGLSDDDARTYGFRWAFIGLDGHVHRVYVEDQILRRDIPGLWNIRVIRSDI